MNKRGFWEILRHSIGYDLKCGIWKRWYMYVGVCLADILIILNAGRTLEVYEVKISFMNLLGALFQGCKEYEKGIDTSFEIPIAYMAIIVLNALINGWYARNEMSKRGNLSILRMQDLKIWWFSKCIWSFLHTILYCMILFVMTFGLNLIWGNGNYGLDKSLYQLLDISKIHFNNKDIILYTMGSLLLLLTSLNAIQLLLQLLFTPTISMIVIIFIMVMSAFDFKVFNLGNYIMLMRNVVCNPAGVSFEVIAGICIGIALVCIITGEYFLYKRDIIM